MLDFNLYYAKKVAEARQEEVERRSQMHQRHGLDATVEAVADRAGSSMADCPEAGVLHRRRTRAAT